MSAESFKRKLTAILSADVKGYSRLMGENEAETVKTLTSYRKIMGELIQQHRGRVIDSPGDNILAEFGSVVDAVQCSVAAQNEFKARNAELPENRRMVFRIGVNLGDVIEEEGRIYGDGVNIAARLEALAEPGGICISKTAFDHIESKLPLGYQFLGEQTVKNIAKPVAAYKVLMVPRVIGGEEKEEVMTGRPGYPHLTLPDKPSIAVLPFVNMSDDPGQEYFSDGMSEDIITSLSHLPDLFVIARNSTFTYKGKSVNVQQVSRELGVKYILEGSVRKVGNRVRVTAQLIDGTKGHHVWAEHYDRQLEDVFAIQDELTFKILKELQVKLTEGEQARLYSRGTENIDAYLKYWQGRNYFYHFDKGSISLARQLLEEVIALDPNWELPYSILGWTHWIDVQFGYNDNPEESLKKAFQYAQKAISLNESPMAHGLLSFIYLRTRQADKALEEGGKSLALGPNSADAHAWYAQVLISVGEPAKGISLAEKALRMNPFPPSWYYNALGWGYGGLGDYERAIQAAQKAINIEPGNIRARVSLIVSYVMSGREKEAHAQAQEVLSIDPSFSLGYHSKSLPFKDHSEAERVLEALRKAGLK
jgi:adenylate cyclase